MQLRFSLLINSLPRNAQLIWAAWFCFRLNQMSFARPWVMVGYNVCTVLQLREMHRPNRVSSVFCTAPSPPPLNTHRVKSLQVLVADSFDSCIYESKQHTLGLAIIRWTASGSSHTSGKPVSNMPCNEEASQGYDHHQAFHDSASWALIWSYLSTWRSKIPEDTCKAETRTLTYKRSCVMLVLEMFEELGFLLSQVYRYQSRTPLKRLSTYQIPLTVTTGLVCIWKTDVDFRDLYLVKHSQKQNY